MKRYNVDAGRVPLSILFIQSFRAFRRALETESETKGRKERKCRVHGAEWKEQSVKSKL